MDADTNLPAFEPPNEEAPAQQRAAGQWHAVGDHLRTITPSSIVRFTMVCAALLAVLWVLRASWPAPLPFFAGGAIAYIVLPLVNRLDRSMPRLLAALLAIVLVIVLLVGTTVLVVRAAALEAYNAYGSFPDAAEIQSFVDDMDKYIASLPDPVESVVREQVEQSLIEARQNLRDRISGFDNPVRTAVLGLANAIAVVLGLLVLPVWLLLVLRDQRSARNAINRLLPNAARADFWGIVHVVDRAFGTYLRGMVLTGIVVGAALAGGLVALDMLGAEGIRYPVALGLLAAFLELIPVLGPTAVAIIAVAIPAADSLETSGMVLILIILIRLLVRNRIASHIERKVIDVHPAILLVVIVALSHFGLIWTLLAAPVAAVGLDLFRYIYGRFSDPPRPAGLPACCRVSRFRPPVAAMAPRLASRPRAASRLCIRGPDRISHNQS